MSPVLSSVGPPSTSGRLVTLLSPVSHWWDGAPPEPFSPRYPCTSTDSLTDPSPTFWSVTVLSTKRLKTSFSSSLSVSEHFPPNFSVKRTNKTKRKLRSSLRAELHLSGVVTSSSTLRVPQHESVGCPLDVSKLDPPPRVQTRDFPVREIGVRVGWDHVSSQVWVRTGVPVSACQKGS